MCMCVCVCVCVALTLSLSHSLTLSLCEREADADMVGPTFFRPPEVTNCFLALASEGRILANCATTFSSTLGGASASSAGDGKASVSSVSSCRGQCHLFLFLFLFLFLSFCPPLSPSLALSPPTILFAFITLSAVTVHWHTLQGGHVGALLQHVLQRTRCLQNRGERKAQ